MSFRNEKIYVTKEDITRETEPQLSSNLLDSVYENGDHYYGTQFALLREELVKPLYDSVLCFRNQIQSKLMSYKSSDIFRDQIYSFVCAMKRINTYTLTKVQTLEHAVDNNGILVLKIILTKVVSESVNNLENVDQNANTKSMQLNKGWILCLSCDYFQNSIIFSVISDCKCSENTAELKLLVDLESTALDQKTFIKNLEITPKKYLAIECLIDNIDSLKIYSLPKLEKINQNDYLINYINILNQRYEKNKHYFDSKYGLLREEFVRAMIDNIVMISDKVIKLENEYKLSDKCYNEMKLFTQSITDFNAYTDVKISNPSIGNFGVVLRVSFDISEFNGIDWGETSRLIQGSLLCFSCDYFQNSFIFGLITKFELKFENKEMDIDVRIHVDIDGNGCEEFIELLFAPNKKYFVIESPVFYEGVKHSLSKLQEMNEKFYFLKYLLNDTKLIKAPIYVKEDTKYDLRCVANLSKSDEPNTQIKNKAFNMSSFDILNCDQSLFVRNKLVSLDEKQFAAFFAAITKQFAIIQGPPGTGKTFVGLKIVNCLLDNYKVWSRDTQHCCPILIVCFKNHALDQFLEGILNLTDNIIRIGFNNESEMLRNHRLIKIRDIVEQTSLKNGAVLRKNKDVLPNDLIIDDIDDEIADHVRHIMSKREFKLIHKEILKFKRRINNLKFELKLIFATIKNCFEDILGIDIKPFINSRYLNRIGIDDTYSDEIVKQKIKMWLRSESDNEIPFRQRLASSDKVHIWTQAMDDINEKNINSINNELKWRLYLFWRQKLLTDAKKKMRSLNETLNEEIKKLTHTKTKLDQLICSNAQIIGATITGAAKYRSLIELVKPKIMIVEEAAEVLEAHLISAIPSSVEHLILIGDHQQLRPITNVIELSKNYNMDVSLFERMIVYNKLNHYQLTLQHRMKPCISELLKVAEIYKDLRNHESVTKYPKMNFTFDKDLFFFNHGSFEDNNNTREVKDKSRSNLFEALFVVELVNYFLLRKVSDNKITVLATYNSQLKLIKNLMYARRDDFVKIKDNQVNMANETEEEKKEKEELRVRVSSVDGFQGEENDILIISFVRSNKKGNIGFLDISNRVCVALSRARHAMYCIGNFESMAASSEMWKKIVRHLKSTKSIDDKFILGCKCYNRQLTMPHQFGLFNQVVCNMMHNRTTCKCTTLQNGLTLEE